MIKKLHESALTIWIYANGSIPLILSYRDNRLIKRMILLLQRKFSKSY